MSRKEHWDYMGYRIERAPTNSSGIRYLTSSEDVGYLRADTLEGVKQLIKREVRPALTRHTTGEDK